MKLYALVHFLLLFSMIKGMEHETHPSIFISIPPSFHHYEQRTGISHNRSDSIMSRSRHYPIRMQNRLLQGIQESNVHIILNALREGMDINAFLYRTPDQQADGLTPLFFALCQKVIHEGVVKTLIREGALLNIRHQNDRIEPGLTPVDFIIQREGKQDGNYYYTRLLIMAGGFAPNTEIYHTVGLNPLIIALLHDDIHGVKAQLENTIITDALLESALIHALTHGMASIFGVLFDYMNKSLDSFDSIEQIVKKLVDWIAILKKQDHLLSSLSLENIKSYLDEYLSAVFTTKQNLLFTALGENNCNELQNNLIQGISVNACLRHENPVLDGLTPLIFCLRQRAINPTIFITLITAGAHPDLHHQNKHAQMDRFVTPMDCILWREKMEKKGYFFSSFLIKAGGF